MRWAGLLLLCAALLGCAVPVEEPPSTTVLKDGDFELRDYGAMTVAEVRVSGGQWGAANRGFRVLAGFIFGANGRQDKIEMTAPVIQERLRPVGPAATREADEQWIVRFVMPQRFTPQTLPSPDNARIKLLTLPRSRYALVRFSGWALPYLVRSQTRRLDKWMHSRQIESTGPSMLAQYDQPWTIWFLRHNEILMPVARP